MTTTVARTWPRTLHPIHTLLLAGSVPLFWGALLSDIAYAISYEIQWTNFAAWLITGALVFNGLALLCAVVGWLRVERQLRDQRLRPWIYPLLLLAAWVLGFMNALVHAKDAWAAMPAGLIFSILVAVLISVSAWLGLAGRGCGCSCGRCAGGEK